MRRLPVCCGFMLVSVLTFMPYLIAVNIVPQQYIAIGLFLLILFVGYDLYGQIRKNITEPESSPSASEAASPTP